MNKNIPLAFSLKPSTTQEIIGQNYLLNPNGLITRMVQSKKLFNLIFYGYPGTGKTSLAISLANDLSVSYDFFNASIDKKEKLMKMLDVAKEKKGNYVIILDEIHRLNKDKQDILLPVLENGLVTVFATTTENPYFTINPAIRSRCQILQLEIPSESDIVAGLRRLLDKRNILKNVNDDILKIIVKNTNGDLRSAINVLDIIDKLYTDQNIDSSILKNIMSESYLLASGYGDEYYDVLSAFHKSMRGSDQDAALYYLARLISTGDLKSITRRIIACCYEDVGLANPQLCSRVVTSMQACEIVGFPECHQILSTTVIEMCMSPKSNSAYLAIYKALTDVKSGKSFNIPKHMKDQSYASASKLGNKGYIYPHDFEYHWVSQQYLPNELKSTKYYVPCANLIEMKLFKYFDEIKNKK